MDSQPTASSCRAYRDAWSSGNASSGDLPSIVEYLPPSESPQRLPTLFELVVLDVQLQLEANKIAISEGDQPDDLVGNLVDQYSKLFVELQQKEQRSELSGRLHSLLSELLLETQFESQGDTASDGQEEAIATNVPEGGRYTPLAEHARGGMGVIWRVSDHKLGREVALKRLPAHLAANGAVRTRFVTEARVTAQLEHPGVVPIYDLTEIDDGQPSYTMKLLRGETLTVAIKRFHSLLPTDPRRQVSQRRLVEAFLSVCRTIAFAHKNNVLHRDIKPDNILLGEFGETAVLDWGLAKIDGADHAPAPDSTESSDDATRQGTLLGTPAYMSPEQARGESADQASDCYGLGAVLYQILTGGPPLEAETLSELLDAVSTRPPIQPSEVKSNVPKPLEAICLKLLAKQRSQRYTTAAEVVADVEHYMADEPVSCARESLAERTFRWMRKHKTQVVAGVSTILLAAISITASVLVAQANQTRKFAETQRVAQARSAAETADAVAAEQTRSNNFAGAAAVLAGAVNQIADIDELNDFKDSLSANQARLVKLANYSKHYDALYHLAFTSEVDRAHKTAKQCLAALEIDDPSVVWHDAMPIDDLSESQQIRIKEQVHGIFLHLAATQAASGYTEFVRINATANIFSVESNARIKSKVEQAGVYLDRADAYRKTTAARYFRLVVKLGTGEMPLVEWIAELVALSPEEPVSAVDCYYTAIVYGTLEPMKAHIQAFLNTAEFLGSETRLRDANQESRRLLQKAVRLEPDYYPAIFLRGQLLAKDGKYQAALEAFSACLRISRDAPEAYTGRAMALLVQGVVIRDKAWQQELRACLEADVQRALELAPGNGQIRQEVGTLQCYDGQSEAGIENLILGLDQRSLRVVGQNSAQANDPEALLNGIELTGDLSGVEEHVRVFKACTYADFGNYRKAWGLLNEFPSDYSAVPRVYAVKAICACNLVEDDQWTFLDPQLNSDELLDWVEKATSAEKHYYRGWYAKVLVLRKLGRSAEALDVIDQLLADKETYTDWQQFEMLWFKGEVLHDLERQEESAAVVKLAREQSEIYYEHFANKTGLN